VIFVVIHTAVYFIVKLITVL